MKKFIIDHIDPFGQGVYKEDDNIFFIPNTLPNEEGSFEIIKKKKGVHFTKVVELTKTSPKRLDPSCQHFELCNGCHFLHTDYDQEILFKNATYQKLLKNLDKSFQTFRTISSQTRLGYRNRIQLHYDFKANKLGFYSTFGKKIISVPQCKIFNKALQARFDQLQRDWKRQIKKQGEPHKGHVELYLKDGQVKESWNKAYSEGGFTQVNQAANERLKDQLRAKLESTVNLKILDLFGGNGNLIQNLNKEYALSVDLYPNELRNNSFFHLNLFHKDALREFSKNVERDFNTLIIDPPRSGFKDFKAWVEYISPQRIIYISCHPQTMIRDLQSIAELYECKDNFLIDLFPATYHLEAMIILEKP